MQKHDLALTLGGSLTIGIFLLPTLINTGSLSAIPYPYLTIFIGLPILSMVGMTFASSIGKKIAILWQLAKFAFVGAMNTAIDFGILNFFIVLTGVTAGAGIILINAVSFSTAVVNSYFWNKEWVFAGGKRANFITFLAVTLIGLSINTGVVYALTTFVNPISVSTPEQWANASKVLATLLSLVWNFLGYRLVVFKK